MKKISYYIIGVIALLIVFLPTVASANIVCNDGTLSPSCSDCHRGCCSHHGGCSNRSSSSSSSSRKTKNNNSSSKKSNYVAQQPTIKKAPKSGDVSLKKVTIDSDNIDISNIMSYSTTKKKVNIHVTANDDKAIIKYNSNIELTIGDNVISIRVIAENGTVKDYKLNITREKTLSNNTNIKIIIDGEEIVFNSFKSEVIYLSNNENKIDIKYELEDKNAKAEIIGNENLKVGQNKVIVKVIAENGQEKDYTIIIEKYSKIEEIIINVIVTIIVIGFFSAIVYIIYYFIKRTKKIRNIPNQK